MKKLVSDTRKPISHVDSKGFSLVELLVALTLFGFLVSGIITFVTAGLEVTEKTESRLAVHRDESQQESLLANALTYPVERLDTWSTSTATTSGVVVAINGTSLFIGTQSMSGTCTGSLDQQFLVTHLADGLVTGENRVAGNYSIAPDGLSVYSGSVRIIGSGVRGGNNGTPLETELRGISSLAKTWSLLVMADPGNEQLLFWNDTTGVLSVVTTRTTGIMAPTSVAFFGNDLLVGAKNGLFRIKDSSANGTSLPGTVMRWPPTDAWTLGKVTVMFDGIANLVSPNSVSDFSLEKRVGGIWQTMNDPGDTIATSGSGLTYTFSGSARSLVAGEDLRIGIANIATVPTAPGHYTANVRLYDTWGLPIWSKRIPYFVRWDTDVSTLAGNVIEQMTAAPLVRKVTGASIFESWWISLDSYLAAPGIQLVSTLPIRDFGIREFNDSIIVTFEEYFIYDCREGNHRSQKRTLILRKKR